MIYIKQYNSLFDSPRVEEPKAPHFIEGGVEALIHNGDEIRAANKQFKAYNKWLSSKIEVIGDHTWQDGGEYEPNVHFRLEERHYTKTGCETKYNSDFYEYSKDIAIPITPKP